MNLEDELKSALRRQEPSPGFVERVLSSAQAPRAWRPAWRERLALLFPRTTLYWATACVLSCVLLAVTGAQYRRHRQGELAKQQVVLALRIAGAKLSSVQRRAFAIGSARVTRAAEPADTLENQ
jgi:hypothetical protein